jgi:hypothetical protein
MKESRQKEAARMGSSGRVDRWIPSFEDRSPLFEVNKANPLFEMRKKGTSVVIVRKNPSSGVKIRNKPTLKMRRSSGRLDKWTPLFEDRNPLFEVNKANPLFKMRKKGISVIARKIPSLGVKIRNKQTLKTRRSSGRLDKWTPSSEDRNPSFEVNKANPLLKMRKKGISAVIVRKNPSLGVNIMNKQTSKKAPKMPLLGRVNNWTPSSEDRRLSYVAEDPNGGLIYKCCLEAVSLFIR